MLTEFTKTYIKMQSLILNYSDPSDDFVSVWEGTKYYSFSIRGKKKKKRSKINRQQKLYALWAGYLILVIHSLDAKIHDSASSDRPMQS